MVALYKHILLTFASFAIASPAAVPQGLFGGIVKPIIASILPSAECLVVNDAISLIREAPTATQFCSSYLGIQTRTVSTTATLTSPTTLVLPTTTGTNAVTATAVTSTTTVTSTGTTCIPSTFFATAAPNSKRDSQIVGAGSNGIAVPAVAAKLPAMILSSACRCLGVPTPTSTSTILTTVMPTSTSYSPVAATTTVTPTSTATSTVTTTINACPTADTSCGNKYIQWAYYYNTQGNNRDTTYSQFDPTVYKLQSPLETGVINEVGGFSYNQGAAKIYGGESVSTTYFVLNHRAYLFAVLNGTYTFTFPQIPDDIGLVWVGSKAYSGWTRPNADLSWAANEGGPPRSVTMNLQAGTYNPLRIIYANAQVYAKFTFTLTAPDGSVLVNGSMADGNWIIQNSCDGKLAPAYPPFGSET